MASDWSPKSTSSGSRKNSGNRRSSSASNRRSSSGDRRSSSRSSDRSSSRPSRSGSTSSSRSSKSSQSSKNPKNSKAASGRNSRSSGASQQRRSSSSGRSSKDRPLQIGPGSSARDRESSRNSSRKNRDTQRASGRGQDLRDARRVGDVQASRRRSEIMDRYRGLVRRVLIALAALVVVAVLCVVAYNSTLFTVENVVVEGEHFLTDEQVASLAQADNTTLLRLDKDSIESRLSSNVWVESVDISRDFPDTVVIEVTERTPAVVVQSPVTTEQETAVDWLMTSDGLWIAPINYEATDDYGFKLIEAAVGLTYIGGLSPDVAASEGSVCTDPGLVNALAVLDALSPQLRNQVSAVYAPTVEQTQLILANNVTVDFGSVSEASDKERIVLEVMAQNPGAVAYINVRVTSHIVWRGLEG